MTVKTVCERCKDPRCFTDRHHLYWPRKAYRSQLEKRFRGMFIEVIPRCLHNEIHRTTQPPEKPSPDFMRYVIERGGDTSWHRPVSTASR